MTSPAEKLIAGLRKNPFPEVAEEYEYTEPLTRMLKLKGPEEEALSTHSMAPFEVTSNVEGVDKASTEAKPSKQRKVPP